MPIRHLVHPSTSVDSAAVSAALRNISRRSSPGGTRLRAQHLLDVTMGSSTPAAADKTHTFDECWLAGFAGWSQYYGHKKRIVAASAVLQLRNNLSC